MKDDFYTFGGGHFWEDVFFYQKWRIQRNYITKKCRLLDNWDIRRHEGYFEECRQAFLKYIEAYEIARQKGHMIIMIHSLGQSKNIFKPLWRAAIKRGFLAAAVNYPSSQKDLEAHVKQFHFFLDHLEDIETISFVTFGAGSAVLQRLLSGKAGWQSRLKISRIVEVAPAIRGNALLDYLSRSKLFGFIIGPMGQDLAPEKVSKLPQIQGIETGIVLSNPSFIEKVLAAFTGAKTQKLSPEEAQEITGAKEVIEINDHHFNTLKNERICNCVVNFLKDGRF